MLRRILRLHSTSSQLKMSSMGVRWEVSMPFVGKHWLKLSLKSVRTGAMRISELLSFTFYYIYRLWNNSFEYLVI